MTTRASSSTSARAISSGLLRTSGFEILDLVELFAPEGAKDHAEYSYVPAAWARRWPSEEIWRARKRD